MLSCKEVSHLVSGSLDRKLPWWQWLQVQFHLMMCRFCSRFRKQTLFLRKAARHYLSTLEDQENDPNLVLSKEARERIIKSLKS